jgi:hypothetical protein
MKTVSWRHTWMLSTTALIAACGHITTKPPVVALPAMELVTVAGMPLNAEMEPMQGHGFTEQEFYVRGEASRYRIDDVTRDARKVDSGHPYVTRVLVRRPVSPGKFNGTVVVEWLNVSAGQDVDFLYAGVRELLLRDGYAWIGVSAQRVGVEQLTRWNPARYGKLTVAASGVDPADGKELDPGRPGSPMAGGDVLSWDIYSQVAATIRSSSSPLMGGFKIKHVIAAGQSQSSFRLSNYFNSIQPLHRLYEGFLLYDRGAAFPHRGDVDAKLISLGTEFMNVLLRGSPPPDAPNQRWWELAGASHNSLAEIQGYVDPVVKRDAGLKDSSGKAQSISDTVISGNCAVTPLWSRVPNGDVLKAALSALNTWVAGGTPPPGFPRLALGSGGEILRDADGRAVGGIRTAALDAPRSKNAGVSEGAGMCVGAGYHVDFTEQQLCQRYGSHEAYVTRVAEIAAANVKAGSLLPEEERKILADARALVFKCGG